MKSYNNNNNSAVTSSFWLNVSLCVGAFILCLTLHWTLCTRKLIKIDPIRVIVLQTKGYYHTVNPSELFSWLWVFSEIHLHRFWIKNGTTDTWWVVYDLNSQPAFVSKDKINLWNLWIFAISYTVSVLKTCWKLGQTSCIGISLPSRRRTRCALCWPK